jgi:hypothetical protein
MYYVSYVAFVCVLLFYILTSETDNSQITLFSFCPALRIQGIFYLLAFHAYRKAVHPASVGSFAVWRPLIVRLGDTDVPSPGEFGCK